VGAAGKRVVAERPGSGPRSDGSDDAHGTGGDWQRGRDGGAGPQSRSEPGGERSGGRGRSDRYGAHRRQRRRRLLHSQRQTGSMRAALTRGRGGGPVEISSQGKRDRLVP